MGVCVQVPSLPEKSYSALLMDSILCSLDSSSGTETAKKPAACFVELNQRSAKNRSL